MKLTRIALSFLLAVIVALGIDAQEADDASEAQPPREEAQRPAPEADDDVFIPSEELSAEDEAVFPVDI